MIDNFILSKVISEVSKGKKLFETLNKQCVSPLEFFDHLNSNPDDKNRFEIARQIAVERLLDGSTDSIDKIRNGLDYDKVSLKLRTAQWLASKLIPKTYGDKIEHNVQGFIDIRAALAEANQRVVIANTVIDALPLHKDSVIDALDERLDETPRRTNEADAQNGEDIVDAADLF